MKKLILSLVSVLCTAAAVTSLAGSAAYQSPKKYIVGGSTIYQDYSPDGSGITRTTDRLKYQKYVTAKSGKALPDTYATLKNQKSGPLALAEGMAWYFYDFSDVVRCGIGQITSCDFVSDTIAGAGYADMGAFILEDDSLKVQIMARKQNITCEDITISYQNDAEKPVYSVYTKKDSPNSLYACADLNDPSFFNGIYVITGVFKIDGIRKECSAYLLVNCRSNSPDDNEFYVCRGIRRAYDRSFDPMERRHALEKLLKEEHVDEENALTADTLYPCMASRTNDDSQYWKTLAHEIITGNESTSANYKALLLHDWMSSHLKYDYYKVNVLKYPRYYRDGYSIDVSQYVSQNYTGVCLDFSSIYAIMCRECGIPCVVVSNDTHAWNAIWLNNRWYEVDLTADTNRLVYGEDVDVVEGSRLYCYDGFCSPEVNRGTAGTVTRFCW